MAFDDDDDDDDNDDAAVLTASLSLDIDVDDVVGDDADDGLSKRNKSISITVFGDDGQ